MDEDIRKLYLTEPIVHKCLEMYLRDHLSYEQALERMVFALVQANKTLKQSLTKERNNEVCNSTNTRADKWEND